LNPPSILIVTPYAAAANNGNVRTAQRWADLLAPHFQVIVRTPADGMPDADVLIALHARRGHPALLEWRRREVCKPAILALTGTDLYHDIPVCDAAALESLTLADRLIVLQERGIAALPGAFRDKAHAIYQSAPSLPPYRKTSRRLRALFVGHLREEKDPFTFIRAAAELRKRGSIEFRLAGGVRDPALEVPLRALLAEAPNVRMLGALDHRITREHIRRSHLLVVPSRMEGGANVIVEAVVSGTAVLASNCDGNIGMLGDDYAGYFSVGDPLALARLVARCRAEPPFLQHLADQCQARAPLFQPAAERNGLLAVIAPLVAHCD
jgi:putative glycosyltransferase (TIGR04348 family)